MKRALTAAEMRAVDTASAEHGMPGSTPAAVVEKATLSEQRVVEGTLLTLPERVKAQQVGPPAILIVGEVVRLRAKLGWFGRARVASATDRAFA